MLSKVAARLVQLTDVRSQEVEESPERLVYGRGYFRSQIVQLFLFFCLEFLLKLVLQVSLIDLDPSDALLFLYTYLALDLRLSLIIELLAALVLQLIEH